MIIGEIRRYLRDNNPVRISRSLRDIAYKVSQVRDLLANKFSREPSVREIAQELNLKGEKYTGPGTISSLGRKLLKSVSIPSWLTIARANAAAAIRLIIDQSDSSGGRRRCEK